jgi:hypothetical protein
MKDLLGIFSLIEYLIKLCVKTPTEKKEEVEKKVEDEKEKAKKEGRPTW